MIRMISKYWWVFTLRGFVAIAFGLAILLRPTLSLHEMVLLFGFFVLIDGGLTIFSFIERGDDQGGWALLVEGIVGLAVCVIVLVGSNLGSKLWPRIAAVMLVYYIAGWAMLTGLFKTIAAIRLRKEIQGEWILGLCGMISIFFGPALFFHAGSGVLAAAQWIGIFSVVLGIFLIFLSVKLRGMGSDLQKN